jgi:RHS repeat-associated protein
MYDPYGRVTVYAPDDTLIGNAFQSGLPMTWKAHRVETEAPLVYMRNRHYSPGLGRFLSVDPIGIFRDALNLGNAYTYGASNPLLFLDRFGLQGESVVLDRFFDVRNGSIGSEGGEGKLPSPPSWLGGDEDGGPGFQGPHTPEERKRYEEALAGYHDYWDKQPRLRINLDPLPPEPFSFECFGNGALDMLTFGVWTEVLWSFGHDAPKSNGYEQGQVGGFALGIYGAVKGLLGSATKYAARGTTRFVAGVEVKAGGRTLKGTVDVGPTLDRIKSGGRFPHRNDGSVFRNREGRLPKQGDGYYREFVHPTPGVSGPGPQRIIQGQGGELFYTPDHYRTFIPLN